MSGSGRQSPSPSTQTGRQLHETPASGKGVDETPNKEKNNEQGLEALESNPHWPMDEEVKKKFAKNNKMGDQDKSE